MLRIFCIYSLSLSICFLTIFHAQAQQVPSSTLENITGKKGNFYFAWGYNKEWYTPSDIHVKQASLQNDYAFVEVKGSEKPGWDGQLFTKELSIPQYNYRMGYFFKDDWAFEINFDHTKFQVLDQQLRIKGKLNGREVDSSFARNDNNLVYQLNNGANFLLFNLVNRFACPQLSSKNIDIALLLKYGIGIVVPHVENTIMGKSNNPGFQFGGVDAALETAVRATFFQHYYVEFAQKGVYANYWGLKIAEGEANQQFGCYELVLSVGFNFNCLKKTGKLDNLKRFR